MALKGAEIDAVRSLCWLWPAWLLETVPENEAGIRERFYSDANEETLAALPQIHARPKGAIFLAMRDNSPAGCVMYAEKAPGHAEFDRMFVATVARSHGLGARLMEAMLAHMKLDGYRCVGFNSALFLSHGRFMYQSLGFRDIRSPEGVPAHEYHMTMDL